MTSPTSRLWHHSHRCLLLHFFHGTSCCLKTGCRQLRLLLYVSVTMPVTEPQPFRNQPIMRLKCTANFYRELPHCPCALLNSTARQLAITGAEMHSYFLTWRMQVVSLRKYLYCTLSDLQVQQNDYLYCLLNCYTKPTSFQPNQVLVSQHHSNKYTASATVACSSMAPSCHRHVFLLQQY